MIAWAPCPAPHRDRTEQLGPHQDYTPHHTKWLYVCTIFNTSFIVATQNLGDAGEVLEVLTVRFYGKVCITSNAFILIQFHPPINQGTLLFITYSKRPASSRSHLSRRTKSACTAGSSAPW